MFNQIHLSSRLLLSNYCGKSLITLSLNQTGRVSTIISKDSRCLIGCFNEQKSLTFSPYQQINNTRPMSTSRDSNQKNFQADRLNGSAESVWVEFIQLALDYNPLNLGQGFPDFAAPEIVTKALASSTTSDNVFLNQYTRGFGHPRLVNILSKLYSQLIGREINAKTEIIVTTGAYQALFSIFMALVNPEDEVIIIEPFFDCYEPMVRLAGGKPVFIPLRLSESNKDKSSVTSSDWKLDMKELESKFTKKTKLIVINTPHNPFGKIFSKQELEQIASLCIKHDVVAVMDEVYEWIFYQKTCHFRMGKLNMTAVDIQFEKTSITHKHHDLKAFATLPGMWDRTVTVGSAGKTFSVTGWKLGWAYGPASLMRSIQMLHQNCVYTCCTPVQEAVAIGFENEVPLINQPESYWKELATMLESKRNKIVDILKSVDMNPTVPEGGYFVVADFSKLAEKVDFSQETGSKDYRFVKWLSKNKKLQGIPMSAFYSEEHKYMAKNLIRFCFIKKDETLNQAEAILKQLKQSLNQ